jgi:hypothetical protein
MISAPTPGRRPTPYAAARAAASTPGARARPLPAASPGGPTQTAGNSEALSAPLVRVRRRGRRGRQALLRLRRPHNGIPPPRGNFGNPPRLRARAHWQDRRGRGRRAGRRRGPVGRESRGSSRCAPTASGGPQPPITATYSARDPAAAAAIYTMIVIYSMIYTMVYTIWYIPCNIP